MFTVSFRLRCMVVAASIALAVAIGVERSAAQKPAVGNSPSSVLRPVGGSVRNDYRSQHFYIHTDLPAAEAQELLERLERMLALISVYWQKQAQGIIECYVVKDLANWPAGTLPDEDGRQMIASGGGITISQVLGNTGKSTVYAGADRGTPQHEAVHAYCHQNFGTAGPTWYAEGMAEMGQYWRKDDKSVQVHDVVVKYIRSSEPKTLNAIVNSNETTGDSWQNYAWRWALCHLLATNPNYAANFRPLGLGILNRRPVSFEQTYGAMADHISFEYLFFLQNLCNGYRVDLCSWDWNRKFLAMSSGSSRIVRIGAGRGWQPSGVLVRPDQTYEIACTGTWKIDPKQSVSADGDEKGRGRLIGVVFKDFQLSKEFEIGADGTFSPPSDGQLHLRCNDDWSSIADNAGQISVKIAVPK